MVLCTGVGLLVLLAEMFRRDVRVDLGGHKIFVSQHFLYSQQVASSVHEMRCERMAEGMRTDVLPQSRLADPARDHQTRPPVGEATTAMIKK